MKTVFFGNTKYSLIGAKIIHNELEISFIVTIENSPVKKFAVEQKIPFLAVGRLDKTVIQQIKSLNPDFFVVEDYGLILPNELLVIPKFTSINIHHSLLPKYRGPSPAPSAILAGEKKSGVTIIHMTDKVDAGDIYSKAEYVLKPDETTDSLLTELNLLGAELAISTIKNISNGNTKRIKQNEKQATFTRVLKREDGFVDISKLPSFDKLDRMIRAYFPWPGVWAKAEVAKGNEKIIKFIPNKKVQVEGKKEMNYKDFLNGYPDADPKLKKYLEENL